MVRNIPHTMMNSGLDFDCEKGQGQSMSYEHVSIM